MENGNGCLIRPFVVSTRKDAKYLSNEIEDV